MKVNQSLLVKASILLVLSLSFIHAQWGIPFGSGFGGFPQQQQPYGFGGGNPFSTGGLGGAGSPFSFDQPYSLPFGSNIGQNYPNYGGYGQNPYGQNQNYPNYGGYGQNPYGNNNQPNNNQNNNMRLRFAGQVYGYNPFYYVANLVAVDLDYISHFASALTNTGYQGYNPFYDPINGMNMMGNQNQQKQNQPASNTATTGNNPSTTNTGTGNTASQADTQKANQEALALVFAKEVQIHVSHLVKQQDSYGPKGVGSLTTQLVDSADKLVTAANAKKWNDYQQEYSNLNNGLNKISYYGMQQNMPSFNQIPSSFQPPNWPNQNQQQQGTGSDANSGNVKGSSFFPFLGNNGQFTMPQAPQAPTIPEIPQQFANMQQQLPKQFSFPDMPQMPQIPQMQQVPQVINQQKTY